MTASVVARPASVLIHVHHLMGIGHLRRAMALAEAFASRSLGVTLATGGMPVPGTRDQALASGIELVQLPPARSVDLTYKTLVDAYDTPIDDAWFALRLAVLDELVDRIRPDVVITETYPFGRRRFAAEIVELIRTTRGFNPGALVFSSVRDILEGFSGQRERSETVLKVINEHYDGILVHADERVIALRDTFPLADKLAVAQHYTGFVDPGAHALRTAESSPRVNEVVVSAGGGVVGEELLVTALKARIHSKRLSRAPWRILAGHNLSDSVFEKICSEAPPGVTVERNRADFRALLMRASVSVSQVGYNTVVDVLASGVNAVLVPFRSDTQLEQRTRAELLAGRNAAVCVAPEALGPLVLARAVDEAAGQELQSVNWSLDGARRSADIVVAELARAQGRANG
jgi:predicted glycosyltransferase